MSKSNRSKQVQRGQETVCRVIEHLREKYRKQFKLEWYDKQLAQIDKGAYYQPDMEIWLTYHYGVEVKGMQVSWLRKSDGYRRASRLKLTKIQWQYLRLWCTEHKAFPLLIVELKTLSHTVPYLYFALTHDKIEKLLKQYKGTWLPANIWRIIQLGDKI